MIRKLLSIIVLVALLSGCAADEPFAPAGDNGDTALQLLVPDPQMSRATRAENGEDKVDYDIAASEADITSLYLVAFHTENGTRKHYFVNLGETSPTKVNGIYSSYTLHLAPADYDLYLLAKYTHKTRPPTK